jgi:hypothetical protein
VPTLRRRLTSALVLLLGTSFTLYLKIHFAPANLRAAARIGQPLPPLMADATGTSVDLRSYTSGRKSIIVIYSPTCRICREMLPALTPFRDALNLLMVSESAGPDVEKARQFPKARQFHDNGGALLRVFGSVGLPTIIFIDANGILRDGLTGKHDLDDLRKRLRDFESAP